MGESMVFWITVRPLGRRWLGSKMPVGVGLITIRIGITNAVTVVVVLVVLGSVPTMVKLVPPAESVPVQFVTVGVAGAARFSRYRGVRETNLGLDSVCAMAVLARPAQISSRMVASVFARA